MNKSVPVHDSRPISWDFFKGVVDHSNLVGVGTFMVDSPKGKAFDVKSHKTGKTLRFYLEKVNENPIEDELLSWEFRSSCGRFGLEVIND
jgi:hypothetical protein